jgi:hypothetical protein
VLIRDDGGTWTAITQPAHAHLAGQLAGHWRPALSADAVLAVEQHDVAWTEWDREPPLFAEGRRAAAFYEAPIERRLAIWRNVSRRLDAQSPYAAVLISLHATNIHTRYLPPENQPRELLDEAYAEQDALLALLPGISRAQAERDADVLFAIDALSLTLCNGWDGRDLPAVDGTAIRYEPAGEGRGTLDPWPLDADEVTVATSARCLSERFDDQDAMQRALAATPYDRLSWSLRPA